MNIHYTLVYQLWISHMPIDNEKFNIRGGKTSDGKMKLEIELSLENARQYEDKWFNPMKISKKNEVDSAIYKCESYDNCTGIVIKTVFNPGNTMTNGQPESFEATPVRTMVLESQDWQTTS